MATSAFTLTFGSLKMRIRGSEERPCSRCTREQITSQVRQPMQRPGSGKITPSASFDALLRGSALVEAQHWLAGSVDQLTRHEHEFIDASTAAFNEAGENSHARYKERQLQRVRARLMHGS